MQPCLSAVHFNLPQKHKVCMNYNISILATGQQQLVTFLTHSQTVIKRGCAHILSVVSTWCDCF